MIKIIISYLNSFINPIVECQCKCHAKTSNDLISWDSQKINKSNSNRLWSMREQIQNSRDAIEIPETNTTILYERYNQGK
jgi:hypothetical protein